jgi:uncharacterized protein (DUF1800 family)
VDHKTKMRHLLRRTHFGTSKDEVESFSQMSIQEAVDLVLNQAPAFANLNMDFTFRGTNELIFSWYNHILGSTNDFHEKMTLFWHNHFTSSIDATSPYTMQKQIALLRKYSIGHFEAFLNKISVDPAMMVYLNNRSNVKKAPNENYAREFMELFTLGLGNYTQEDIKEVARCLTGWRYNNKNETVYFEPSLFDDGTKNLFRYTGNFNLSDMIHIIAGRTECANFIAKKIWMKFVHPSPSQEDVQKASDKFKESALNIKELLRYILTSDRFYRDENDRAIIKDPTEYIIELMRKIPSYEFSINDLGTIFQMGMPLMKPPNVGGWKEGDRWLSPTFLFARGTFASKVTNTTTYEALAVTKENSNKELLRILLEYTGMYDMTENTKAQLSDYAASTTDPIMKLRGLMFLIYMSPEAHVK